MAEARFIYSILLHVDPAGGGDYLAWLENKHIAEVVGFPGFLWARRVRLETPAADGWERYLVIYGLESRRVLARYHESDLFQSFAAELKPFDGFYRLERLFGDIDFEIG